MPVLHQAMMNSIGCGRVAGATADKVAVGTVSSVCALTYEHHRDGEFSMEREHVRGTAEKAKGAVKDAAGKMTGDKELEAEGKVDKAKGAAHKAAGDVKEAARKASE